MIFGATTDVFWILGEATSPWVYVGIVIVLLAVLILPRRLAKRSKILDDPNRRKTAQEELRHSMDRLLVELQETAREINATIDTKMIALNRLIEEADRRIEKLEKARRQTPAAVLRREPVDEVTSKPTVTPHPRAEEPVTEEDTKRRELEREIYRLADEGKTELEIARMTDTPRGEVELVLSLRQKPDEETSTADGETP